MDNRRGVFYILGAAVLWGTTGTAQALAPDGAQPLAVGALRLLTGGLALLAYFAIQPGALASFTRDRLQARPVMLAAGCMAAYQALFFAGVARTGVVVGTIIGIGSAPVLAGLLGALFRGERPGLRWTAATLLAVAGCTLLALQSGEIDADPVGMLLAVGAGGAYATFSLASKGLLEKHPVEKIMAVVFCLGALLILPALLALLWTGESLGWLFQVNGAIAILHLGLFATALAYLLFGKGLHLTPVASAVTLSLAEPVTAALLGLLVLGEQVTWLSGAGILLICSGMLVLTLEFGPDTWYFQSIVKHLPGHRYRGLRGR